MLRYPVEVVCRIKTLDQLEDIIQRTDEIIKNNPNTTIKMAIEIVLDNNSH